MVRYTRRSIPATFSGASGAKPWLFATALGGVFVGQGRSEGQTVVDGEDDKHDQTDGNNRMHDEHQPMPRRRVRPFDLAFHQGAVFVSFADDFWHKV